MEVSISTGSEFKRQFKRLMKKYHSLLHDFEVFGTLEKLYSSFERRQAQSDTAMGNKNNFFGKLICVTTCNIVGTL